MSDTEYQVTCGSHGERPGAFVCQHLLSGVRSGFNWAEDPVNPDAQCPDAWCNACDAVLQKEGEWNERAMAIADMRMVCALCYDNLRERNWMQNAGELDQLLDKAAPYLQDRQARVLKEFKIDRWKRYEWSQITGQIVFSDGEKPRVIADVVFVGSLSTKDNTWLWSWANSSFLEPVKATMREVRAYGAQHRMVKLVGAHWSATEEDGWEMTAIAALLLRAAGAYRTPAENGFSYMLMTSVKWAQ